jgi:hypothetical protein
MDDPIVSDWKKEPPCRSSSSFSFSADEDDDDEDADNKQEEEASSTSSSCHPSRNNTENKAQHPHAHDNNHDVNVNEDVNVNVNEDAEETIASSATKRSSCSRLWNNIGPYCVLLLCLIAAGFTFIASWSCSTFYGAEMPWLVGGGYGIWSLQDSEYNCQLWSVLFFAYKLDAPLRAARFLSMMAMLLSLASIAILTQIISWGRIGSWFVATALICWLGDSISYWWRYNVWSTFFMFTYFLMVLLVKCFLLEHYAPQTLWRLGRRLFLLACLGSTGIFCILASRVCMCEELSEDELEYDHGAAESRTGSEDYNNNNNNNMDDVFSEYTGVVSSETYALPEHCSGMCVLGPTSITAIMTPFLWIATWLVSRCVRPSHFSARTGNQVAAEEQEQLLLLRETPSRLDEEHGDDISEDGNITKDKDRKPRPRLATATTFGVSDDDDEEDEYDRHHSTQAMRADDEKDHQQASSEALVEETYSETPSSSRETAPVLATIDEAATTTTTTGDERAMMHNQEEEEEEEVPSLNYVSSSDETITTNNSHFYKRTPTRWRKVEHVSFGIVTFIYVLVIVVMVGAYFENKNAAKAPDTSYNFLTDVVCGYHPLDSSRPFETFDNTTQAQNAGYEVAHCGGCGECSNPPDIEKYVETRKTVADSAKKCSIEAIFGKDEELADCLEREIGFTRSCTGCWAANMKMTAKHCMWTCLSSMLIGITSTNTVEGAQDYDWLNQCVFCDEKRSGPDFVQCSGVARRRLGIQSEFERNPLEQCPNVKIDYVQSNLSQVFP